MIGNAFRSADVRLNFIVDPDEQQHRATAQKTRR